MYWQLRAKNFPTLSHLLSSDKQFKNSIFDRHFRKKSIIGIQADRNSIEMLTVSENELSKLAFLFHIFAWSLQLHKICRKTWKINGYICFYTFFGLFFFIFTFLNAFFLNMRKLCIKMVIIWFTGLSFNSHYVWTNYIEIQHWSTNFNISIIRTVSALSAR